MKGIIMSNDRPLWAPWRIEFIKGAKEARCFLCGQEPGKPPAPEAELVIFRGDSSFVILNRFPYNSGHLMIAPYAHAGDISLLSAGERHELMDLCVRAKDALQRAMAPDAFNAGFNLGAAAGAGVADHLHLHLVPRWSGDTNFMPVISDTRCIPEALEATARLIREHWR